LGSKYFALPDKYYLEYEQFEKRADGCPTGSDLTENSMAQTIRKTVLFLCTGNYYRSRFAEILFNSVATKMGLAWSASSRGLALERGANNIGPVAASAVKALEAMGIRAADAMSPSPAQVATEDLEAADRIVALKKGRASAALAGAFPGLGREGRVLAR